MGLLRCIFRNLQIICFVLVVRVRVRAYVCAFFQEKPWAVFRLADRKLWGNKTLTENKASRQLKVNPCRKRKKKKEKQQGSGRPAQVERTGCTAKVCVGGHKKQKVTWLARDRAGASILENVQAFLLFLSLPFR